MRNAWVLWLAAFHGAHVSCLGPSALGGPAKTRQTLPRSPPRHEHASDVNDRVRWICDRFLSGKIREQAAQMRQRRRAQLDDTAATTHDRRLRRRMIRRAKGGSVSSGLRGCSAPATEGIALTFSAADHSNAGMIVGRRPASMVLPVPGGPVSTMTCPRVALPDRPVMHLRNDV